MEYYIENLLKHVKETSGFYIECGAYDGVAQSYCYELEKRGWRGLLIEPSRESLAHLKNNRDKSNIFFNCALVGSEETKEITGDFDGSPMASVDGNMRQGVYRKTTVPCRTLNSILAEINVTQIDLLCLDVEGYEIEVLKGFDLRFYHPTYVVIEVANKHKDAIMEIFTNAGYSLLDNLTNFDHNSAVIWDNSYDDILFVFKNK